MADIAKGNTLSATGCTREEFYTMLESATITNIANADCSTTMGLAASKINFAGLTTAITYTSNKPKRSIVLTAAGAVVPATNGAEQAQTNSGTEGQPSYWTLNYDKTTDEHAYWTLTIPTSYDDGNVYVTVYWTTAETTEGRVCRFAVSFKQIEPNAGVAIDGAFGTATDLDDAIPASHADGEILATSATVVTGANFGDADDVIIVKVDRDVDKPTGTQIDADVKILAVKIEYSKDQDTD